MTKEEMRIAIAERCGWEQYKYNPRFYTKGDLIEDVEDLPDYCNDLNAMHEVEKVLDAAQKVEYSVQLHAQVRDKRFKVVPHFDLFHATAAQRAEAFCRTLWPEKWK